MSTEFPSRVAANDAEALAQLAPEDRYTNRELSWLSFNRRVLAESENERYPLLERLRFLSISASNLDEFTMVRIAGLEGQVQRGIETLGIDGSSPRQQLAAIREQLLALEDRQQASLETLRDLLSQEGILLASIDDLSKDCKNWLARYFESDILPLITPQAIDPSHPFPFVANRGIGVIFRLKRGKRQADLIEMVLIPSGAPRFVRVPGDEAIYVGIEQLVTRFADQLFPGFKVLGDGIFRVLRDSDIEVEEEAEDLVRYFRTAIQRRRRGRTVLLELDDDCDEVSEALLRDQLDVEEAMIVKTNGMLGLADLATICGEPRPDLKFEPFSPRYPERILEHDGDCFAAIREKDIVIHHPFESFDVVVDFLHQAAVDPAVVSIKQTLYRAGDQSPVIAALIEAAQNGKAVTAVVELKARFDEERNIHWASELERAGVQVIYGFTDWKTHAKVSLVVRREEDGYRTYCHFGTGNYHPVNAKIYTDLSFFTADATLGRDAAKMFNFITGYIEPDQLERISLSPIGLQEHLYELIDAEIANAKAGKPAGIWVKLNSITNRAIIDKLYEASRAGVEIRMVVRGICSLRAGLPGISENISVKSVIGRFLEHSRVWAFANGKTLPSRQAKVYLTSADAMSRNLEHRVEVMVPITNKTVHDQVLGQVMLANILDTEQSWRLDPDGQYRRMRTDDGGFNCHQYFMSNPSLSGRGAALTDHEVPRLTLGGAET
ncbi:MAG: RNA degradosome polyphosphate kinase [Pseudomonadota bacterium]|jgi:polyphosphate kinase|uniref:RNA degradosome polyphosphate kinase n=1 Tax=Erythrobacteraceae TaxID=335929 RepID=UPI000C44C803|nr:RNA degradosome polyphosphate kinase [Erythrobacter sp. SAORIC-644]MAB46400.1 RNA degradosome polyphosphate kinase [Sphingomonadaceae bacterium]MEC7952280.1 RNA degradosome polyphosphate kinase [Pseudomonadota bacterium]QPL39110.1 RNA degradosome polyphosphate kinase [Erythrobacter sp. A30-3]MEE2795241.1 RNA degradosome polyphosphate kinase [Pseudomonadota bacterium]PNQ76721.1 RNA degradosome polyphosphate kinase [Erythrobacter sp. SAORIC-644]|tara:strand:- start:44 stop:2209 length:2166 start_codon:yes stop_codon:yes gene_type:complete